MLTKTKQPAMGGRCGTARGSYQELIKAFGNPCWQSGKPYDYEDDKVTFEWSFKTPRGVAAVRDYWWNVKGKELSLAAGNPLAALWLARFLRRHGFAAKARNWKELQEQIYMERG